MLRKVLAVLSGAFAGGFLMFLIESLGYFVYHPPVYLGQNNPEALENIVSNAPVGPLLFIVGAWVIAAIVAGIGTAMISPNSKMAMVLVTGIILTGFGALNLIKIHHPVWIWFAALIVFIPFAYVGGAIGTKVGDEAQPAT